MSKSPKLFIINLLLANDESIIVGVFPTLKSAMESCKACRVDELCALDVSKPSNYMDGMVVAAGGTILAGMATGDAGFANGMDKMSDEETDACESSATGKFEPHLLSGYYSTRGDESDDLGVEIVEVKMGMLDFNYNND
jgi:hypothetical protein